MMTSPYVVKCLTEMSGPYFKIARKVGIKHDCEGAEITWGIDVLLRMCVVSRCLLLPGSGRVLVLFYLLEKLWKKMPWCLTYQYIESAPESTLGFSIYISQQTQSLWKIHREPAGKREPFTSRQTRLLVQTNKMLPVCMLKLAGKLAHCGVPCYQKGHCPLNLESIAHADHPAVVLTGNQRHMHIYDPRLCFSCLSSRNSKAS